jgi:hypothetical protein
VKALFTGLRKNNPFLTINHLLLAMLVNRKLTTLETGHESILKILYVFTIRDHVLISFELI